MKTLFRLLTFIFICLPVFAQQSSVREVEKFSDLRNHVQDINRTRFVKGYSQQGDGAHGLFIFTNTSLATNIGTRIEVTGKGYSWERQHEGVINIRWFGARDSALDNSAAIQAAIDYASANRFTVFVPTGNFTNTTRIDLPSNTSIKGEGPTSVLAFNGIVTGLQGSGVTNLWISRIKLAGLYSEGMRLLFITNATVRNCFFTGATRIDATLPTSPILVDSSENITIESNEFRDNGNSDVTWLTDYTVLFLTVTHSKLINNFLYGRYSKYGIATFDCSDLDISGNYINQGNYITTAMNSGYGILAYSLTAHGGRNIRVRNNTVTNCAGAGIYLVNHDDIDATGNRLYNTVLQQVNAPLGPSPIVFNGCWNSYARDNIISNSPLAYTGIYMPNNMNSSADGNWIWSSGGGINVTGKTNSITNNRIFNTVTQAGVAAFGDGYLIAENTISDSVAGIYLDPVTSNSVVTANRIFNTTVYSIQDLGAFNTIVHNICADGLVGIRADGTNGLILPNTVLGHATGLLVNGVGYRVDPLGRYHDNAIPISDPGGAIIKAITSGSTPSVKDSPTYLLNYATPTTITGFTDGLLGMRRTFSTANTNATIASNANILLDGAYKFDMKPGDTLTLELDAAGVWRQMGKSINGNYVYYDRALELFVFNAPIFHANTSVQQTAPSTTSYQSDHQLTTNTAGALIARWKAGANQDAFAILNGTTNGVLVKNGIFYSWPFTNGLAGQVLATDGSIPHFLYWTNSAGGGSSYLFDPTQFDSAGGFVAITNNALTTNIVLKGAVRSPTLNVSGVNIDAATGTEFSKQLASNTSMGIINMTNDQSLHITFTNTTFTLSFTNTDITWISSIVPVLDTNAVNVFHFRKTGGRIFGSDPEQVANANEFAITTMTGTGVMIKTNATTIVTQDPLSVRYGGTGTNTFASVADGNVVFHKLAQNALGTDDAQFTYSSSLRTLYLARTVPTGSPQLVIFEASGVVPVLSIYDNKLEQGNDDLSIDVLGTFDLLAKINSVTALKVSRNLSTIIGDGTTTTTRTNKFLYIPSTLGPPTGIPTIETGTFAIAWDSSNDHLYIYDSGWKQLDGGGITGLANPSASIGLSAINGTALTAMRSDAAPPLSQSITPVWTGFHVFSQSGVGVSTSDDGWQLDNPTDATAGSQQYSPTFSLEASGWNPTTSLPKGISSRFQTLATQMGSGDPMATFAVHMAGASVIDRVFRVDSLGNVVSGPDGAIATTAINGFFHMPTTAGTPTGVPMAYTGKSAFIFDTTGNKLWGYDGGWIDLTGAGGGASDNWVALVTTNSQLYGEAFVHAITSTNGFFTGSGVFTAISASMRNNGGIADVINNSATRLSSVRIKGGTGAESFVTFNSGNTNRGQFESNGVFQAFYGMRSSDSTITNGITILDVAASKLLRTDTAQKAAAVTIGAGLTFNGTTLDVAGGGALAGSGTPTFYSQWTGATSLGDGGLYHIDSTAVGLGTTNFFLHTHGGVNNLGLGEYALQQIDGGGIANTAIGRNSQAGTTTGDNNVSIGEGSLQVLATGDRNVAIGNGTLAQATSNGNSMFGYRAGNAISTSTNNTGAGYLALNFTTSGRFNSALGGMSGFDNLTGNYNTYLGAESGYFDGNGALTFTNTSQVGFGSLATNSNAVVLGNANVTRWQLGNNGPTILKGTGTPEGADQGNVGDIFFRTDGGAGTTMYWKETGSGNTGWASKGSMSSEVTRLHVESGKPPAANPARLNPVSDYLWEVLFDPTTSQSIGYSFIMPQGYGTALKVRFKTTVKTVQTGTKGIVYRFSVAAMKATEDPTNPTFATANSVTVTLGNNQAANAIVESTVNLTNADSVVAGDLVLLKVDRNAADGADDATGDSALTGSLAVEWLRQ